MSEHLSVSASPPGPLSTYVERGSTAALMACAVLLGACRMDARQQAAATPDANAARSFVVDFYAWYYPAGADTSVRLGKRDFEALRDRALNFRPELREALAADVKCRADSHEICNLDSDPFLASQDPCARYEVGGSIPHGDTLGVSIFGVCNGVRDSVPAVVAMVMKGDSGWQFANFVYPAEKADLLSMLAQKAP